MLIIKQRYDDMSRHSTHHALVSQTLGTEIKLIWPLKTPRNQNILYVTQYLFYSFSTSNTIWRHKSGSTLAQVMACCLTAPSHYLNQCWLVIGKVQWLSSECNFTRYTLAIITEISLKTNYIKFCSNLSGADKLLIFIFKSSFMSRVGDEPLVCWFWLPSCLPLILATSLRLFQAISWYPGCKDLSKGYSRRPVGSVITTSVKCFVDSVWLKSTVFACSQTLFKIVCE